ncbi:mediator of RNA polymerase II transcription subunit 8-like isoform X2 [Corticium candelabrum]|nr:mediator of RNA polymerase II transcription subunit 8-like isoform X2 [Corticium candelabrum]
MLLRQIKHDKTPPLQNSVVLPVALSQQRDEELERLTEGRVPVLHHEIVPDYLRTKLDLELESQEQELEVEVAKLPQETVQEQVASLNDRVRHVLQLVSEYKENWEERT